VHGTIFPVPIAFPTVSTAENRVCEKRGFPPIGLVRVYFFIIFEGIGFFVFLFALVFLLF
jgi:hypothetical protein